jgi:glucose/arabinose dehydrogenase
VACLGAGLGACSGSIGNRDSGVVGGADARSGNDGSDAGFGADAVARGDSGEPSLSDGGPPNVGDATPGMDAAPFDAEPGRDGGLGPFYCSMGVQAAGASVPAGYCVRRFAQVGEARALVMASNGDLFVAAPSAPAPGGASNGPGAIVVLSDDNHDGVAELSTFVSGLDSVHGIAIGDGYLYYTTQTDVWRVPYTVGQRQATAPAEPFNLPASFAMGGRWTHGLARSVGGAIYASRGQYGSCDTNVASGEISSVASGGMMTAVATGFRNPMYLRCHPSEELCVAAELGEDGVPGAREKLVVIRAATNYGYPCCYTANDPSTTAQCATVTAEEESITLGDTPFGHDWERGVWGAPYQSALFIAKHGSFYSEPPWAGAGIGYFATDPTTHSPVGSYSEFVSGFGPGPGTTLKRPSDVTFGADGRMYFSDDMGNAVYWVAPTTLRVP